MTLLYWRSEANPGVCTFTSGAGATHAAYGANAAGGVFGDYNKASNLITIYDEAARTDSWSVTFPLGGVPIAGAPTFTITVNSAPDMVNLTYAHEATHRLLQAGGHLDTDGDRVPDAWEIDAGMNTNKNNSFGGAFALSHDSPAARDEEFYCVLGGAVAGAFGTIGGITVTYHGITPVSATNANDWSKKGFNWKN